MNDIFIKIADLFTKEKINQLIYIVAFLIISFLVLRMVIFFTTKALKKRISDQMNMLIKKIIFYVGGSIILITALKEIGISISALLGAIGIVGVAIGFASQTSISNIISGIFLISEKSFSVGDLLKIGETVGYVISIDLLAVKLRTFDNKLIRIPNETIIKTELANITKFPIRRIDLQLSVAYKENVERVKGVLNDIANKNPYCLNDPEPLFIFSSFGASGLDFLFCVWGIQTDYLILKNSMMMEIKKRFDDEGIEIPFPHISLYKGSVTDPFPVEIFNKD